MDTKFLVESNYYSLLKEYTGAKTPNLKLDSRYFKDSPQIVASIEAFLDLEEKWTPIEYSVIKKLVTHEAFQSRTGVQNGIIVDDDYQYTFPDDREDNDDTNTINLKFCFLTTYNRDIYRLENETSKKNELLQYKLNVAEFLHLQLKKFLRRAGTPMITHSLENDIDKYKAWKKLFYQVYVNKRGYQRITCQVTKVVETLESNINNDNRTFKHEATNTPYMARIYDCIMMLFPMAATRIPPSSLPISIIKTTTSRQQSKMISKGENKGESKGENKGESKRKRSTTDNPPIAIRKTAVNKNKHNICQIYCEKKLSILPMTGDGDCQFLSISAISETILPVSVAELRNICATKVLDKLSVTDGELFVLYETHLDERRNEKWFQKFRGDWRFEADSYRRALSAALKTNDFWGDEWTLDIIALHYHLCFFVVNDACNIIYKTKSCYQDRVALLHYNRTTLHYSPIYASNSINDRAQFFFDYADDCINAMMSTLHV